MDLADFIRIGGAEPTLRFLIIGGYAVAAHGHTRATFDVDLLALRRDRMAWEQRLADLGLHRIGESSSFSQFTQPKGGDGLDLMWVDDSTFEKMWQASEIREFQGDSAHIPCLDHLLALKLHALRQALPHRTSKDAEDVETLVRRHRLNLNDPLYKALFLKYGNQELYDTFLRLLRNP